MKEKGAGPSGHQNWSQRMKRYFHDLQVRSDGGCPEIEARKRSGLSEEKLAPSTRLRASESLEERFEKAVGRKIKIEEIEKRIVDAKTNDDMRAALLDLCGILKETI